jgi:two-component system phosphate regulon sensor histidine kinase PhoR
MKQFSLSLSDVGRPIQEVRENFRFPTIIDNIEHVINTKEILEKEIQTTDLRWYQMNIIPYVRLKDNRTDGVIITFVEITARINDLREKEKLISDHEILLDTLSHDIKSPLTNLVLAVDGLKHIPPGDESEFKLHIEIVERALGKINNLLEDLTKTRKEGHPYEAEEELLNIEHIFEDVRLILNDNILKSGAKIKTDVQASELKFSRRKLRSIIYNLINNSIKFADKDRPPEIIIKTYKDGNFIIISVKDNGIGIDPSKFDSIFSKYYRLEHEIEGSGIGLYLVKEIVMSSGGKITVASEPHKGTEFRLFLPA